MEQKCESGKGPDHPGERCGAPAAYVVKNYFVKVFPHKSDRHYYLCEEDAKVNPFLGAVRIAR